MPKTQPVRGAEPPAKRVQVRRRPAEQRGWAAGPVQLEWRATPAGRRVDLGVEWNSWFVAEVPSAKYLVCEGRFETTAVVQPRELGGRPEYRLGAFKSVAAAMAACEADFQRRLQQRQELEPEPERKRWRRPVPSLAKRATG